MPSTWHVKTVSDNFDKVLEANRQFAGKLLQQAGRRTINHIKDTIVETGSVDTGAMLNSVEERPHSKPFTFNIGIGVDYWQYTNSGTRRIPARHWLEEGMSRGIEDFNNAVNEWVKRKR